MHTPGQRDPRVLLVLDRTDEIAWKSFRNLGDRVRIILPEELNTYDVLVSDWLVFTKATLDTTVARLRAGARRRTASETATEVEIEHEPTPRPTRRPRTVRTHERHDPRDIIIRPIVSEKSYASFDENVYTFEVAPNANKIQIKHAIEEIFGVKVTNVNTLNRAGQAQAEPEDRYLGPAVQPEAGDRVARRG